MCYRRRLEVNVAQYEAALCAKVEGFDYAHGNYGGCLWAGEIGRERHDLILIWQSRNHQKWEFVQIIDVDLGYLSIEDILVAVTTVNSLLTHTARDKP